MGQLAATVDGMLLEISVQCLPDVRASPLSSTCCSDVGEKIGET